MSILNTKNQSKVFVFLFILALLVLLSCVTKYWAPFDEGIVTVGTEQLLKGAVPYKDFFLVMYPPMQLFVLAFIYKVFWAGILAGRLYTVIIQFLILLIFSKLTEYANFFVRVIGFLLVLSCLGPRMGTIPSPIWPSIMLSLLALLLFKYYIDTEHKVYFITAALVTGLTMVFRHDIGLFLFLSVFAGIFLNNKNMWSLVAFTVLSSIFVLGMGGYLYLNNAMPDAFESLIKFTSIHESTAGIAFPKICFNPVMIFHGSMSFINQNQFYIPILVIFLGVINVAYNIIKNQYLENENIFMIVLVLFGSLVFNQVRIRTDPAHLLTVMPVYIILCSYYFYDHKMMPKLLRHLYRIFLFLTVFLFILLGIKNYDKSFKNILSKPFKGKIVKTSFGKDTILYIPKDERDDVVNVIDYIKANSKVEDYVYIGNINHNQDAFGGTLLIYTLSKRSPSTKYYELLPGLVTQKKVQDEILKSLIEKDVKLVVLQDIGVSDNIEPSDLDKYIITNYKLTKKFGPYNIYEKKDNIS